jgi:predicted RNA-binding Zn ribbon-like protein
VDLFTGIWIDRIRICDNPLCGGLFADLSRPGRRRWCAMNTCGSLAKKEALQSRQSTGRPKPIRRSRRRSRVR